MARRITWALGLLALALPMGCDSSDEATTSKGDAAVTDISVAPEDIGPVECWSPVDCTKKATGPLAACKQWGCVQGACVEQSSLADTPCSGDVAALGACERWACNDSAQCVVRSSYDGTACGTADGCIGNYCADGKCAETTLKTCNDGNPCTADSCEIGVCDFVAQEGACDDGNPCTQNDGCFGGACKGTPKAECNCTKDSDCPDDGDPCNGVDKCVNNFCQPDLETVIECLPAGDCMVAVCNPESGQCEDGPSQDGKSCDDGDPCTAGDSCTDGACTPGAGKGCETECADGNDDDGDGDIDCDDVDCADDAACKTETNCKDKLDDDEDGKIDCADEDCVADAACQIPTKETNCVDTIDNDQDGKTDCDDEDCKTSPVCKPKNETNCTDTIDEDKDGKTDCDDEDCAADPACAPKTETSCNDGADNDDDTKVDCADEDCAEDVACKNATCQAQGPALDCDSVDVAGDLSDAGTTTTLVNSYGTCSDASWAGAEVVYLFTAPGDGSTASFTLTGAPAGTGLFLIGGATCDGGLCTSGGGTSITGIDTDTVGNAYLVVDSPSGATGTFTLTVSCQK